MAKHGLEAEATAGVNPHQIQATFAGGELHPAPQCWIAWTNLCSTVRKLFLQCGSRDFPIVVPEIKEAPGRLQNKKAKEARDGFWCVVPEFEAEAPP